LIDTYDIKITKLYNDVIIPQQVEDGSAGYDLRAYIDEAYVRTNRYFEPYIEVRQISPKIDKVKEVLEDEEGSYILIYPNECIKIGTGIATEFSNKLVAKVYLRSSIGVKSMLRLLNGTGIIDSSYRNEWLLFLQNTSTTIQKIRHNERIAQIIFEKLPETTFIEVNNLNDSIRGEGGIGSSGQF
jgi:dUTP pyrophosphatase